jgi:hypothetical protein
MSGESNASPSAAPTTSIKRLVGDRKAAEPYTAGPHPAALSGTGWVRTSRDIESKGSDEEGNGNEVLIVGASPKDAHARPRTEDPELNEKMRTTSRFPSLSSIQEPAGWLERLTLRNDS